MLNELRKIRYARYPKDCTYKLNSRSVEWRMFGTMTRFLGD